MPVALDPNEIYRYVLSTDRAKKGAKPPTLLFHYPTGREVIQIGRLFEQAEEAEDVRTSLELRFKAIKLILAGWENFTDRKGKPIPSDPANADMVLSDTDLAELDARLLREMAASELDKKKFAFSALSSSAESAAAAPAGSAPGRPAKPSRRNSNASPATATVAANAKLAEEAESSD